jgi:hypothetical protein
LLQFDSKRIFSSDFAMPIALSYAGYTYAPWKEIVQKDVPNQPDSEPFSFEHYGRGVQGGKPEYNRKMQPGDEQLYSNAPADYISKGINCQLCWDPNIFVEKFGQKEASACASLLPVPCFTKDYSMWEGFKNGCSKPQGRGMDDPVTPEELVGVVKD